MKLNHKIFVSILSFLLFLLNGFTNASTTDSAVKKQLLWSTDKTVEKDTQVAFRGTFSVNKKSNFTLKISGASWYVIWLDGKYLYEGPDRYDAAYPEYQQKKLTLTAGNHLLAVQVHYEGIDTRILKAIQPFLYCSLLDGGLEIPIAWKCTQLTGYDSMYKRINAQLGWVEWADTRKIPADWQKSGFKDSLWIAPVQVQRPLGTFSPSNISNVKSVEINPVVMAEGKFAEVFGYEKDNPSARFFLSDLECNKLPQQGSWKRYDLGRVRLMRPKFIMDLPQGAVVEFAYSEQLSHSRVVPWITLSASDSYNMDHFVARGGIQEFFPLTPKGGRFMEIHILAAPDKIKFISEKVLDRCYYDTIQGRFASNDSLLNKIWRVGIDTYLSCSEDALVDNPTRERGQWLGDVGSIGLHTGAAGFSDIKIIRRGLVQSSQCARADGMVAGLCPGGGTVLSTYAAQWVPACLEYWRLTGDKTILDELYPAAVKNMEAFSKFLGENGISRDAGWAFVDWGYVPNDGPTDMGLNLHCYLAFRSMEKWATLLDKKEQAATYKKFTDKLEKIISAYFAANRTANGYDFEKIGYHRTALGLNTGFISNESKPLAIAFIKKHILSCFPNNPEAPRLSDPKATNLQLITPYFAHFVFPYLIENGEMDFVLNQYKKCWGWALEDDRTTWVEVFDSRWSHCHQWASCPTWQLSRYVLGLKPRFDLGKNRFDLDLHTGDLTECEGEIPLPSGKTVHVKWEKKADKLYYVLTTSEKIFINIPKESKSGLSGLIQVKDKLTFSI